MIALFDAARCSCIKRTDYESTTSSNYSEPIEFLTTDEKEILTAHFKQLDFENVPVVESILKPFTENRSAEKHFLGYVS